MIAEDTIPFERARELLLAGVTDVIEHPASVEFRLANGSELTLYDSDWHGREWVLTDVEEA
jgi:hypothetical protein